MVYAFDVSYGNQSDETRVNNVVTLYTKREHGYLNN